MYSHKKVNQQLTFFGTIHSHDPKNVQYIKLENAFKEFAKKSTLKKVVLIEGTPLPFDYFVSKEDIICNEGDRGFAHFLGKQNNIEVIDADMQKNMAVKLLLEEYSLDTVYAWAKNKIILMWERFGTNNRPFPTCEEYVHYHLSQWFKGINLTSLQTISTCFSQTDKVNSTFLKLRQKYTFEVIQNYWNQGYDIFIVYGNAHARAHKNNIKTLLK